MCAATATIQENRKPKTPLGSWAAARKLDRVLKHLRRDVDEKIIKVEALEQLLQLPKEALDELAKLPLWRLTRLLGSGEGSQCQADAAMAAEQAIQKSARFYLYHSTDVLVPSNFDSRLQLDKLRAQYATPRDFSPGDLQQKGDLCRAMQSGFAQACQRYHFEDVLTDDHYDNASYRLEPSMRYKLRIWGISLVEDEKGNDGISSRDCIRFLLGQGCYLTGAAGLVLAWRLRACDLPEKKGIISFDWQDRLFRDAKGAHLPGLFMGPGQSETFFGTVPFNKKRSASEMLIGFSESTHQLASGGVVSPC